MEGNKSFKVDYPFYKSSVATILLLVLVIIGASLGYIVGVCDYVIEMLSIGEGGVYYLVFILLLLPYILLLYVVAVKWIFPRIRLKEVVFMEEGITFYRIDKEIKIRYEEITKIDINVNGRDKDDSITQVNTYYFYTKNGGYAMLTNFSKTEIMLNSDFHQTISDTLGLGDREYNVKLHSGNNTYVRTYQLKE